MTAWASCMRVFPRSSSSGGVSLGRLRLWVLGRSSAVLLVGALDRCGLNRGLVVRVGSVRLLPLRPLILEVGRGFVGWSVGVVVGVGVGCVRVWLWVRLLCWSLSVVRVRLEVLSVGALLRLSLRYWLMVSCAGLSESCSAWASGS